MRLSTLVLPLALLLSGCPCPEFVGLDDVLTFRACDDLERPLMRDSQLPIELDGEELDAVTTWVSDDLTVVAVAGAPDDWWVQAWGVGEAEVTVTSDAGEVDRLRIEVVDAASATLGDTIEDLRLNHLGADSPDLFGDFPDVSPGEPLLLAEGQEAALLLEISDSQGRAIAWSEHAVVVSGVASLDGGLTLQGPGEFTIADNDGNELLAGSAVEFSDYTGAQLHLGLWHPERVEFEEEITDESGASMGVLRAVVTNADGQPVQQPPVEWTIRGPGAVEPWVTQGHLNDVVSVALRGNELESITTEISCVTVSIETPTGKLTKSAWLDPAGPEVYDNDNCDARLIGGCACSTTEPGGASFFSLLLALGLLSRRRRSGARRAKDGGCRTAA